MLAEMPRRVTTTSKQWPVTPQNQAWLEESRDDLMVEAAVGPIDSTTKFFIQEHGPFTHYQRRISNIDSQISEDTEWTLDVPWFGWLFRPAAKRFIKQRAPGSPTRSWWTPSTVLSAHDVNLLGLLAAASLLSAFVNTLFTQTVTYAADDFGIGTTGQGLGAAVVRWGIVLAIPFAIAADRIGRRRVMVLTSFLAPTISALGALAPNFQLLVVSQAIGRPLALTLDLLIMVTAAEEMPKDARAYALSVLAMASGLGAGVAVFALPVAGISISSWRWIYVIALLWLVVAQDLRKRLPETKRFIVAVDNPHRATIQMSRLALIAGVAFIGNLFVATVSIFQNRYLKDVRDYAPWQVALFTIATSTPASLGLIIGGRIADARGRRLLASTMIPIGTALVVVSFTVGGSGMWAAAAIGSIAIAIAYPAMSVYRAELFPTQRRGRAAGLITASALMGGSIGLIVGGVLLDNNVSYAKVMAILALGPLLVGVIVLTSYPETAHQELEEINPSDRVRVTKP